MHYEHSQRWRRVFADAYMSKVTLRYFLCLIAAIFVVTTLLCYSSLRDDSIR